MGLRCANGLKNGVRKQKYPVRGYGEICVENNF